jgi:TRAP-type C4-dicarboxylate transport system substrate-binding protein
VFRFFLPAPGSAVIQRDSTQRGLRFCVIQNEVFVNMVDAPGASATPMAYGEVYTALSTGVIDGAENNYPSFYTSNHYEVAGDYTQDEHLRVPEITLFSQIVWDRLSEEDRELIQRAAAVSVPYQRAEWTRTAEEFLQMLEDAGVEIITEIDKQPRSLMQWVLSTPRVPSSSPGSTESRRCR